MTPGQVVEVGRNDCAVPPGTRGVWLGTVPETGCALVLLPGGRRVSLLAEQWRVEGGEWAGPRTLAAEPAVARPAPVPRLTARPVPRPRTTAKPTRVCTVEGCEREPRAHGWCQMHYRRWLATGDPLGVRRTGPGTCSVPGCDRTVRARGWCRAHYRRWLATGDVRPDEPVGSRHGPASRTCSVPGCDRTHLARGLCATHYARGQRRGFGADLAASRPASPVVCTVPGCGREHHGRGLCKMHWERMRRRRPGADLAARGMPPAATPLPPGATECAVDGCPRATHTAGLCKMHYARLRRTGSTGEATPRKWPAREAA